MKSSCSKPAAGHGGHVFTGREGLSDGLYADFVRITSPGQAMRHFLSTFAEFNLSVIPTPTRKAPRPHPAGTSSE